MRRVSLAIRPMTLAHLDDVMSLEEASFPEPWPRSLYEREIKNSQFSRYKVIVPLDSTAALPRLLGQSGYWLLGGEAHIVTLAVHPAWRRHELGKWLLLTLIGEARNRGAEMVTLEVRPSNKPARSLYQAVGFVQTGQRRRYYPNGEDALILELSHLADPAVWEPLGREANRLDEKMQRGIVVG